MINPLNQSQLNQISQPGQGQLNQLNQTLQNVGQINRQNKLNELSMQGQQQNLDSGSRSAQAEKDSITYNILSKIKTMPVEARYGALKEASSRYPFIFNGGQAEEQDAEDARLDSAISATSYTQGAKQQSKLIQGEDENGSGYFQQTPNGLVRVQGANPMAKAPLVNISNGGDKGMEQMSKNSANEISADRQKANSSREMNTVFDAIERDMSLFQTGKISGAELSLRQAGDVVGVGDKSKTAAGERLKKNFNKLVSQNMEFLKGAMSDSEREFTREFTIGMDTTTEGNTKMIEFLRGVNNRYQQKAKMKQDWFRQNRGDLFGFDEAWDSYISKNPILTPDEMNSLKNKEPVQGETMPPKVGKYSIEVVQ